MHQKIYKEFEKILCKEKVSGKVLEVGAVPSKNSLLSIGCLKDCDKVGINLEGDSDFSDFKIVKGNANDMKMFESENFNCVICNATLEHDKFFWKSILEMKRVLKRDGFMVIGVPVYTTHWFDGVAGLAKGKNPVSDFLSNSAVCFKVHDAPGDYYRFSEQAIKEVFFDGFRNVEMKTLMTPPRTIAFGHKD